MENGHAVGQTVALDYKRQTADVCGVRHNELVTTGSVTCGLHGEKSFAEMSRFRYLP